MFKALFNLFFPKLCVGCKQPLLQPETILCVPCAHNLPLTQFHANQPEVLKNVFYGQVYFQNATALFYFHKKGISQQLIHQLKYKGNQRIGVYLGEWLASEIKNNPNYQQIDVVIPVPIHKNRMRQRGYNQVEKFGIEIANALDAEYIDTVLLKTTSTKTQVFKKRIARWDNSNEVFTMQNKTLIEGKHILLVDDIITTGATIESCANILLKAENVKISVATMAIA